MTLTPVTDHWSCPACGRTFRRPNQRHACGTGDRGVFLAKRPPALVRLFERLEQILQALGPVETVARDGYVLFRTTRIVVDLTFLRDALRVVMHLNRVANDPHFIKVVRGSGKRVSHVARVHTLADLRRLTPYLREAYQVAEREDA